MIDSDFDALMDRITRREAAIRRSTNTHTTAPGPRPDAEPTLDVPILLWPDEAHKIPDACPRCGSRMIHRDIPNGSQKYGDATCGLCSRMVVRLQYGGTRSALPPEMCGDCQAVPASRWRAGYCNTCFMRRYRAAKAVTP